MPNQDQQFDTLPPAIVQALRELDGPAVMPDPQRDADLLSGARLHLAEKARLSRKRRNLRLLFAGSAGGAIAAAAMITIVVFIGNPPAEPKADQNLTYSAPASQPQPGDLDNNGTLNILDAYTLAKQINQGQPNPANDFNNDGQINQLDIDFLANKAVALNTGEQS